MDPDQYEKMWELMRQFDLHFVDEITPIYKCYICKNIIINAAVTPCDCRFCFRCVNRYLEDGPKPCLGPSEVCKEELLDLSQNNRNVFISRAINWKISKLQTNCPNGACQSIMELNQLADHLIICDRKPQICPFASIGCRQDQMTRDQIFHHISIDNMDHVQLMIDYICQSNNELNELKRQLINCKSENEFEKEKMILENKELTDKLQEKIDEMNEMMRQDRQNAQNSIRLLVNEVNANKAEIDSLNEEMNALKHTNQTMKEEMKSIKDKILDSKICHRGQIMKKSTNMFINIEMPSWNESEGLQFTNDIIERLRELQNDTDYSQISNLFRMLKQSYYDMKKYRVALVIELKEQNYILLVSNYLTKFKELGYLSTDDVYNSTLRCLSYIESISDISTEFSNDLSLSQLPKLLIDIILCKSIPPEYEEESVIWLLDCSMSIIHNITRFPGNKTQFKSKEIKDALVYLIKKEKFAELEIIAMILLALIVDEDELDLLNDGKSVIKSIIKYIETALESNKERFEGFEIWELINGLKYISSNDSMKKPIVQKNGIRLMFDVIKNSNKDVDIEMALGVLWNLCFDKDIKDDLVNNFDMKNVIVAFENHKSSKIKKCVEGILWLIDGKHKSTKPYDKLKDKKKRFDVFFSYSKVNESTVLQIVDELNKKKLRVWIDRDQMKDSTLEAMSEGIENSDIFIITVSDSYKKSSRCHLEAEYANELGKPILPIIVEPGYKPKGWLGILKDSKIDYEFTERKIFQESFEGLMNNINEVLSKRKK